MSGIDAVARGLAVAARADGARARLLDRLARGIARVGGLLPELSAAPPTLDPPGVNASAINGQLWSPNAHPDAYTFLRADWGPLDGPPFDGVFVARAVHPTPGAAVGSTTPLIRFRTAAPDLEVVTLGHGTAGGYRLKIDGAYAATGVIAATDNGGDGVYQRVRWGDGSAAQRRVRLYELECEGNTQFLGVKLPTVDSVWAAPPADGLRVLVHGDSFVQGTGSSFAALRPSLPSQIGDLLGQPDCWGSGVGSTGFISIGTGLSTFNDRVTTDVIAPRPDLIVELGGLNDNGVIAGDAGVMAAAVTRWLTAVTTALPDALIVMTGHMCPSGYGGTAPAYTAVRDGKRAAAARFPGVVFVDNIAESWVTGTGHLGAETGDGNADWVTSADGTHPSDAGHAYLARRVVDAIAARLPTL